MKKKEILNGVHGYTDENNYVIPETKELQEAVEDFMDLKLGLMIHWSPGSQMSSFESWPLSDGDGNWSQKDCTWTDIETFKKQYIDMNKTFNPIKFRPDKIAQFAKDCGFRYLLFTTKHHDGFCMFDTKTTDYKITDKSCPFSNNKYANIVKHLYDEFRKLDLKISTYFSKPDWHSNYYWSNEFPKPKTRNVNYSIKEYPEIWDKYINYCHEQIRELATEYGPIDVLWLDGGWVNKDNLDQDFKLEKIVNELRLKNPKLLVCDRLAGDKFENIVTPEQNIPAKEMYIPWETCITVGKYFSFHYNDEFKSELDLLNLFLNVISKGGNLALNIPLQPDGEFPEKAIENIRKFSKVLNLHKEGIYNTRIYKPYYSRNIYYTQNNEAAFAFYVYNTTATLPIELRLKVSHKVKKVELLRNNQELKFIQNDDNLIIYTDTINLNNSYLVDCFKLYK